MDGKIVIGMQMYTLRDFCKSAADIAQTLKKVSTIGYRVIQASGMAKIPVKELKKIADDNGLYICSSHTGYDAITKELDRIVDEHLLLGCEAVICPALPMESPGREAFLAAAREFEKVLPKLRANKLILGYHNHSWELEKYGDKTGLELLLDNCPGLESEIDTYWIQHGGGDPANWIEKYSGRASEVHFKDMGNSRGEHTIPPIGAGNLDWSKILKACRKARTRYALVEMDTPTIEPFEAARISFENMRHHISHIQKTPMTAHVLGTNAHSI